MLCGGLRDVVVMPPDISARFRTRLIRIRKLRWRYGACRQFHQLPSYFGKYRVDNLVKSTWYTIQHPMLSAETDGVRVEWS
jgi:hypothetical protein